jgi:hypothetical protein
LKQRDHEAWLYDIKYESASQGLESVAKLAENKVNLLLFSCDIDVKEVFQFCPQGYKIDLGEGEAAFTLNVRYTNEKRKLYLFARGLCLRLNPSVYLLVSDYQRSVFVRLLGRLVNRNYPMFSRLFLKTSELYKIFVTMEEQSGIVTNVFKSLDYSRIGSSSERIKKNIEWTNEPFRQVFRDVAERGGWVKKIYFIAGKVEEKRGIKEPKRIFEASISSDLLCSIEGNFQVFYEHFIKFSLRTLSDRLSYLTARSQSVEKKAAEPLVLKFDERLFEEGKWNERFIDIMSQMKNVMVTRYHPNPYVHVSLLDYQDGSSYGVWVVSSNEINIIPQSRATVASMNRLLSHIFENIKEGEITKYVTVEDYDRIQRSDSEGDQPLHGKCRDSLCSLLHLRAF